jgi:hypothetical protein
MNHLYILKNRSMPDYILVSEHKEVDCMEWLPYPWRKVRTFETGSTEIILDMIEGEISYEKSFDNTIFLKRTQYGIMLHVCNKEYVEQMLEGVEEGEPV